MNIQEFRVGNFVLINGITAPILSIHGPSEIVTVGLGLLDSYAVSEVLPIPLTLEILSKTSHLRPTVIDGREILFNGDDVIVFPENKSSFVFVLHSEVNGEKWILRN